MIHVTLRSKMLMHIAFDTCHQMKHEYTITPHNKKNIVPGAFYSETSTPKSKKTGNFGKSKTCYYWKFDDKETFTDIKNLLQSKNLEFKAKAV